MSQIVIRDLWALRLQTLKTKAGDPSESDTQPTIFTSTSGESDSAATYDRRQRPKHRWFGKDFPKLLDTLGLCYLGMLLLRLPCSLGDINRWAEDESIIYIRAIRFIPKQMKSRLPAQGFGALDTRSILKPDQLQKAVHELVLYYNKEFGIRFPVMNFPLLSFKYIKELALPLDIYLATKNLAGILGYSFSYKLSDRRHRITELPELQLMSLIVVALKLSQGFDMEERSPKTDNEAASLIVDWDAWRKSTEVPECISGPFSKGGEIGLVEGDVFNLSDGQMDRYMDWYGKMWVDDAEPKR
jgi:RNA polymerase I-specific transcription initiation factor RRN7